MRKLMIFTVLMFSSIIISNACVDDFNSAYNQAESNYDRALGFCNKNYLYVPSADDFCREQAYMEYSAGIDAAIAVFEDCFYS